MTVYPDVDAASMNYVLRDKKPRSIEETELEFRLKLILTNVGACEFVLNGTNEASAYKLGYVKQALKQLSHDVNRITDNLNAVLERFGCDALQPSPYARGGTDA